VNLEVNRKTSTDAQEGRRKKCRQEERGEGAKKQSLWELPRLGKEKRGKRATSKRRSETS